MKIRKDVTKVLTTLSKSRKKEKANILDEFCQTYGYERSYTATLLRNWRSPTYLIYSKDKNL